MASSSYNMIYAALIGNALIAIAKFVAAIITGSSAMISEGIHSVVDTGNQFLLLHGIRQAKKSADTRFPFGHGRELYFWSFIVAILIFALGAGVSMYEGVRHLSHPSPIESPLVNYMVLGLAFIFQGSAWSIAMREFHREKGELGYFEAVRYSKDPSLFVMIFEDSAAMLGLVVAFVGILLGHLTGWPYFDGIASVLIGLILAATGIWLIVETKSLLIGESATPNVVRGIRQIAQSCREIRYVNEILTMQMGPDYVLVNISVEFDNDVSAADIEIAMAQLDTRIKQAYPMAKRIFIEGEARHADSPV
ncbi:cation transporter [Candidatus Entotheonella serta]|nr:cation transporter [Candidatus Entotheonella serta]